MTGRGGENSLLFSTAIKGDRSAVQLIIDLETGMIMDANYSALVFYGWSREEILTLNIGQINTLGLNALREIIQQLDPDRQNHFEFQHRIADGSIRDVDVFVSIVTVDDKEYLHSIVFDISDRKSIEKELIERSALYKSILTASPDMIVITGMDLKISFVSPKTVEIMALDSDTDIIGRSIIEFIGPGQEEKLDRALASLFEGDTSGPVAFRGLRKNGQEFCAEINVEYIRDSKGTETGMIFIVRDVSERKNAERQLKESEVRFRTIVGNAPLGIFQFNNNGVITECNDVFVGIIGSSRDILIGLNMNRLPDEKIVSNLNETLQGARTIYEGDYKSFTADKVTPIRLLFNPVFSDKGKVEGGIGIVEDITDRKIAEKALQESEFRFKSLIDLAVDAILLGDSDGRIIGMNEQAVVLTGYTKDELHNSVINVLFTESELSKAPFRYDLLAKGEVVRTSRKLLRKDGTLVPIEMNTKIMPDQTYQSILRDVSERYKAEEELKKALEKAKESDRLKSAFLANMSHEIRTPMNGIMGFAQLLKNSELSGEKKDEYVDIIQKSGNRMLNIINDLIDISKVESGQMEVNISSFDINEQLDFIRDFFMPEIQEKGLELELFKGLYAPESFIEADKEKVLAILTNLVKNALKFTSEGMISFGYRKADSLLEFFVKDTGPGIAPEKHERIFERFVQADLAISKPYEGAGLGLSISRAYVEMMDGKIWVESKPKKGSTFYFTIPLKSKAQDEEVVVQGNSSRETGQSLLKILLVEDEETSMMLLGILTEEYAKETLKATSGEEAVQYCRDNMDIDLVLMDIKLPDIDGYEVTRQIRKLNKEVVIIAQSAFGLAGDHERAIKAGCNDYIIKPVSEELLKERIDWFFGGKDENRYKDF